MTPARWVGAGVVVALIAYAWLATLHVVPIP